MRRKTEFHLAIGLSILTITPFVFGLMALKIIGMLVLWSFLGMLLDFFCGIGEIDWCSSSWHEDNFSVVSANVAHPLHFSDNMWMFYFICGPMIFIPEWCEYKKQKTNGRPKWSGYKHISKNQQSKYYDV